MSGKAKLASKNAGKRASCPAHGHQCETGGHAVTTTTKLLEFRRNAKGNLTPKSGWQREA